VLILSKVEKMMHVRPAVAIGLALFVLGLGIPVSAATTAIVSVTQLSTSASIGNSGSTSVACMSPGNCVASGYESNNRAIVQTERDGRWGSPIDAVKNLGKIEYSILITTSCYATGCIAFGRYSKAPNTTKDEHFTVSYSSGRWAKAIPLSLSLGSAKAFEESRISCSDERDCLVVGSLRYSSQSAATPTYAPAVLTEKAGRWGAPQPLAARVSAVGRLNEFVAVSCPSAGNCVAVGDGSVNGTYGSIEAVETNGQWSQASDAFPAYWTVLSVSCPLMRDCIVGGRISTPGASEAFVSSGRVGHWSEPVQVGKKWTVHGESQSSANFLSCQSAANCIVAGMVDGPRPKMNGKVSISSVAWLASETNGTWNDGTLIGYHGGAINEGQVDGLSCSLVRSCEAVGEYGTENSSLVAIGDIHNFAATVTPHSP
jgi:hypothetical protein